MSRLSSASSDEEWRPVLGYEGRYEVSSLGRVRSLDRIATRRNGSSYRVRGIIRSQYRTRTGHLIVGLTSDRGRRTEKVHRLVCIAFHGLPEEGQEVCHGNDNPEDNRASNLRWGTRSENRIDRVLNSKDHNSNKTHCTRGHELREPNLRKSSLEEGRRGCLSCARAIWYCRYHNINDKIPSVADEYYRAILEGEE